MGSLVLTMIATRARQREEGETKIHTIWYKRFPASRKGET